MDKSLFCHNIKVGIQVRDLNFYAEAADSCFCMVTLRRLLTHSDDSNGSPVNKLTRLLGSHRQQ